MDRDAIDERPQAFFEIGILVTGAGGQRSFQAGYRRPVATNRDGVKIDVRLGRRRERHGRFKLVLFPLDLGQAPEDDPVRGRVIGRQRVQQPPALSLQLAQSVTLAGYIACPLAREPAALCDIRLDIGGHHVRIGEKDSEPVENLGLDAIEVEGATVAYAALRAC